MHFGWQKYVTAAATSHNSQPVNTSLILFAKMAGVGAIVGCGLAADVVILRVSYRVRVSSSVA
jgi:hypothetical protein